MCTCSLFSCGSRVWKYVQKVLKWLPTILYSLYVTAQTAPRQYYFFTFFWNVFVSLWSTCGPTMNLRQVLLSLSWWECVCVCVHVLFYNNWNDCNQLSASCSKSCLLVMKTIKISYEMFSWVKKKKKRVHSEESPGY